MIREVDVAYVRPSRFQVVPINWLEVTRGVWDDIEWECLLERAVHVSHFALSNGCLLYTSPSPRDKRQSRMPSSA